jgi:menaquinol-cytochrome c reductase iron-sulfur subunit
MADPAPTGCACCQSGSPEPRRGFVVKLTAVALGAAAFAAPVVSGVVAFVSPLRRKEGEGGGSGDLVRLATLAALPEDGTPRKFTILRDRADAWNLFPNEPVGAVYLRRAGPEQVEAIQVVCPHAGCFVGFDPEKGHFVCPCHMANFELSGKRMDATSASPRDLDSLEVEVRKEDGESWVYVKFQNFRIGTAEKTEA